MPTEPKTKLSRKKLTLAASLAILAILVTVWHFQSFSQSSHERDELRDLGENVTSVINAKDFARLEEILGNPVAVEAIRDDVGGESEPVRLGQVQASNPDRLYFTVITSSTPEKEIFVYVSKDESGSWWAYVP